MSCANGRNSASRAPAHAQREVRARRRSRGVCTICARIDIVPLTGLTVRIARQRAADAANRIQRFKLRGRFRNELFL